MLFLDRNTVYRCIQRELPEGAYPDGAASGPKSYFSTSDSMATAMVLESLYRAASGTYQEFFPATSTKRIDDWVFATFGQKFDSTVDLLTKQNRVLAKLQKQGSLATWPLLTLALSYVPQGTFIQLYHPCGPNGLRNAWQLGVSQLGFDTYLSGKTPQQIGIPANVLADMGDLWCPFISNLHWRLGVDELGVETFLSDISYIDISSFQADAYLYTVKIFNFGGPQLSASALQALSNDLSANEPARSAHRIVQNLDINTSGLNTVVPNANQFSGVDCAEVDPSSETGYTGRTQ